MACMKTSLCVMFTLHRHRVSSTLRLAQIQRLYQVLTQPAELARWTLH